MCVSERFLETLRLLEHPSEDTLVCEAGPRGDAVSVSICLERVCRKFETIHQPSAAEQLASSLALGKEHPPSMPRSRRADFPILLAIQYVVKPALLDDERMICAAIQAGPLARAPLRLPGPCVSVVADNATAAEEFALRVWATKIYGPTRLWSFLFPYD